MEVPLRKREKEVWQALDDLWAMNGDITLLTGEAIKDRLVELGKAKGSPNEIYKYKKTWINNRKVHNDKNIGSNDELSDPISRAVNLVRESIKEEADIEIKNLTSDFEEKLKEHSALVLEEQKQKALLLEEYNKLSNAHLEAKEKIAKITHELEAEKDIRRAVESNNNNVTSQNSMLVSELAKQKDLFAQTTDEQKNFLVNLFNKEKEELKEKIKDEGLKYSESLMQMRMSMQNLNVKYERELEKNQHLENKINSLVKSISDTNKQCEFLIEKLAIYEQDIKDLNKQNKILSHKLTKYRWMLKSI